MTDRLAPMEPGEILDYRIKTDELLSSGETVDQDLSAVVVTGATMVGTPTWEAEDVTVFIAKSSAALGTLIKVAATIRTDGDRTFKRTYFIPFGEPVSMELVKQHLRVAQTEEVEDLAIAQYIRSAREFVEKYTGVVLVRRSFTQHYDQFPVGCRRDYLELWRRPIAEVTEVAYSDSAGDPQTYADFVAKLDFYPARVWPALNGSWPSALDRDGVLVTYVAGYAEGEAPEVLVQAILMLIAHWYNQRETATDLKFDEVPFGVKALCDTYRTPVL